MISLCQKFERRDLKQTIEDIVPKPQIYAWTKINMSAAMIQPAWVDMVM